MKLEITVRKTTEIEIDETKLETYADEARSRFAMEADSPINMVDLLIQAKIDGDIDLPDFEDWDLADYDDDLSPEEIAELSARS